jgi:hypothetical protein
MARDQEPVTDDAIEGLREQLREQRREIRDDLDGDGVDVSGWSVEDGAEPVPDGGSE